MSLHLSTLQAQYPLSTLQAQYPHGSRWVSEYDGPITVVGWNPSDATHPVIGTFASGELDAFSPAAFREPAPEPPLIDPEQVWCLRPHLAERGDSTAIVLSSEWADVHHPEWPRFRITATEPVT